MTVTPPIHALLSRLKLRHLRVALALNELGSAAQVAARFHISPAAVSKTLAELEEIAGLPLFERGRRGMVPTEVGAALIQSAAVVCAEMMRLGEYVDAARLGTRGQLTLAYRTMSAQPFLAQAVCAFHEANPQVHISVIEGAVGDLIDQLTHGELDLLYAYEDPRFDRSELQCTPVIDGQQIVVVSSCGHPLQAQARVRAPDLVRYRWCLPAFGSRLQHHFETSFRQLGLAAPTQGVRTSDIAMAAQLLRTAEFLTVFPQRIAQQLVSAQAASTLPFALSSRMEPVIVVRNAVLRPRAAAEAFLRFSVQRAAADGILSTPVD